MTDLDKEQIWNKIRERRDLCGNRQRLIDHLVAEGDTKALCLLFDYESSVVNSALWDSVSLDHARDGLNEGARHYRAQAYEGAADAFYRALAEAAIIQDGEQ
jgi:hypothetical protein